VDEDIPYLLLTPGPLTTSLSVRRAMLRDSCTWDADYNALVNDIRRRLVRLATAREDYTCILMQGSGTFAVEATLGSVVPPDGKILIVNNGAYGRRMVQIADRLRIARVEISLPETEPADLDRMKRALSVDPSITHVAMVHCETTTGLLNPAAEVGRLAAAFDKTFLLDSMSSLGGIPLTMESLGAHFLISSANKCLQGVPGFAFVVAERSRLEMTRGWARSLSLDLFDQWREMEEQGASGGSPHRPTLSALSRKRWTNWRPRAASALATVVTARTKNGCERAWRHSGSARSCPASINLRSSPLFSILPIPRSLLRHFTSLSRRGASSSIPAKSARWTPSALERSAMSSPMTYPC
jgi:2-aminoethylphosphonate aminotransferase